MSGLKMTALQGFTLGVAVVSVILSVGTALLGDWFKERFGFRGMARLTVEIENKKPFFSHSWIRHVSCLLADGDSKAAYPDDRINVEVLRVRIRNIGNNAAKNVSVWLTHLHSVTPTSSSSPDENVMALRWADTWRFVTDKSERTLSPSDTEMTFPLIPAQSAKFCDLCVFYDPDGPARLDQFKRGWLYFAVFNMPSRSYAKEAGSYEVVIQAVAENAKPIKRTLRLEFDPNHKSTPLRVAT